jgi:N,N'-diacetyllegionaminate synthase
MRDKVIIIAEAGVNHNGSIELAKKLIDEAAEAGADYVKFQTFKTEKLVSSKAKKASYQIRNMKSNQSASQFDMLKKLELSTKDFLELKRYCKSKNIKFLSTAFDLESLDELFDLGMDFFKVPSGEISNLPYLIKTASFGMPVVLSTGMCSLCDIERAIEVLSENGIRRQSITVLHCNTEYPTPARDVNLRAMQSIQQAFQVKVGYSDHTEGIVIPIASVAMGATIIEKHFTLDKSMDGPDHKASLEPKELNEMVRSVRFLEKALGDGIKKPSQSEVKNLQVARRSIHLAKDLKRGTRLREQDLEMLRPGDGISPMNLSLVLGKKLIKAFKKGHKLNFSDIQI